MNTPPESSRIVELLIEQVASWFQRPFPAMTPRVVRTPIALPQKATAVVGIRRAGKTYFLHQVRKEKVEQEGKAKEQLPYVNFEDERLVGLGLEHLTHLVEEYYRLFPDFRSHKVVTWFFDEIQLVPGWERFVRRLLDTENAEVFLSGSSATLLSREIATAMRGRAWEVLIFPFSFAEFLAHHGYDVPRSPTLLSSAERSRIESAFREYLRIGGFPEVQGLDTDVRFRLLSDYVDVAILRDVVDRHQVRNVTALRWLVRHLLGNPGGLFSVEKFYRLLKSQGLHVSRDTLHEFLVYLEDCFLIRLTYVETASERQRMVNPRKVYPVDPGLIPVYDRTGRANLGHALETAVRIELERRGYHATYVKIENGYEVDFLTRSATGETALIQVCADLTAEETVQREIRALERASERYPQAVCQVLTLTPEIPVSVPDKIHVVSAAAWFLRNDLFSS